MQAELGNTGRGAGLIGVTCGGTRPGQPCRFERPMHGASGLESPEAQSWTRDWSSEERCRLKTEIWETLNEEQSGEEEVMQEVTTVRQTAGTNPKWVGPQVEEELGLALWEWLKVSRTALRTRSLETKKSLLAKRKLLLTLAWGFNQAMRTQELDESELRMDRRRGGAARERRKERSVGRALSCRD